MATTPVVQGRGAAAPTPAASASTAAGADTQTRVISRREFMYYIWGASMALLMAETSGAIVWYALPRFRAGEFGGVFNVDPAALPAKGSAPVPNPAGKYWLSNTNDGVLALSMVCTHLGCLFKWVPTNNRFECPCHGSKFEANGKKIIGEGPAQRDLDRFVVTVTTPSGSSKTDALGHPVKVDGAASIAIDTGKKIRGQPVSTT